MRSSFIYKIAFGVSFSAIFIVTAHSRFSGNSIDLIEPLSVFFFLGLSYAAAHFHDKIEEGKNGKRK